MTREQAVAEAASLQEIRQRIWDAFRRWGYLQADLDPLGDLAPSPVPELEISGADAEAARRVYCGTIGAEFMHLPDRARRLWVQERMESETDAAEPDRARILNLLVRAEVFEHVLQTRYLGTKRYSLEGEAALLPLLDSILRAAADQGAETGMLAMSHRGRLNVMVHIVGRAAAEVFARFEDVDPRSVLGSGDVKYHLGATGVFHAAGGREVQIHLVSNPSHLEAVDPVIMGRTRAKQIRRGERGRSEVLAITMHGDAAFAGQGICAETLNMTDLPGYTVGGGINIIVNNLIGFTTPPREGVSSRFSSDLAKRIPVPIFHVNAEDPEAVVRVGRIALDYRYTFGTSAVIDLIGYRRHGHSEVDDPTITQPLRYRKIEAHPPLWKMYAEKTGADGEPIVKRVHEELDAAQREAREIEERPPMRRLPRYWSHYRGGYYDPSFEMDTAVSAETLAAIGQSLVNYPAG
ncbi:MAG: 2-oxoglutarate dehydrogenase E1 component, partial [Acidobacteriota bacterium]|nr:2-oxoglutarate dehydrogenase E1 component [Acidobacteriota bacterium]